METIDFPCSFTQNILTSSHSRRDHQLFRLDLTYAAGEAAGSFRASPLAGVGHPGLRDGPASMAVLNTPTGLALADNETALYVADSMNHVIRKVRQPCSRRPPCPTLLHELHRRSSNQVSARLSSHAS